MGYPQHQPTNPMAIEPNSHLLLGSEQHNMLPVQPGHGLFHYSQSQATSLATSVWGSSGTSSYAANRLDGGLTLDPALRENNFSSSTQSQRCYQQLPQASAFGNQYIGSSFRETNVPAQGTNNVAKGIYYPGYLPYVLSSIYISILSC